MCKKQIETHFQKALSYTKNKLTDSKIKYFFKRAYKVLDPFFMILKFIVAHIVLILVGMFLGIHLMTCSAHARTIYYGTETEDIHLKHGTETVLRFNEPVKTISQVAKFKIGPTDSKSPDYTTLSVSPRYSKGSSKVTFILASGSVVSVKMNTYNKDIPEELDSFYDFIPKKDLIEKDVNGGKEITDLSLMKAMIKGQKVYGIKERKLVRNLHTGMRSLKVQLVRVYTGAKHNGYVFLLKNKTTKDYLINIKNLSLGSPNKAILSQVDKSILKQGESTFLRIVAKPTSVYYNVNLPVGVMSED